MAFQCDRVICLPREAKKTTLRAHKITAMLLCKYTRGALEVLGMDVNVLDGDRYRHHYTPPCLHSLSLRCHSVFTSFFVLYFLFFCFALAVHPPSHCPPLLLPVPGQCPLPLLSTIPLYLLSSRCPFISHSALAVSSPPISPSSHFSPRYRARTAERVRCPGLFHPSRLRLTVKRGTNVRMLHF